MKIKFTGLGLSMAGFLALSYHIFFGIAPQPWWVVTITVILYLLVALLISKITTIWHVSAISFILSAISGAVIYWLMPGALGIAILAASVLTITFESLFYGKKSFEFETTEEQ